MDIGETNLNIRIRNTFYLLLGLIGFKATPAMAAQDMFLCIDGIPGESQDKRYMDCIDVLAWSWGVSNSGSTHTGGGGGTGKASFQDISLTKFLDKSSPILMLSTANGKVYPKVELFVHNACGNCDPETPYFRLNIENFIVSSISTGGSGGEDRLTENVSLNFSKVDWCYAEQKADGSYEPEVCKGWDIETNMPR